MSEHKVAIVTAASQGMGAGCARELARRGYKVALLARSESIRQLAVELDGIAHQGSVTEADDLAALVEMTLTTYGRIDAVINNTGHPPKGDLLALTDDDWRTGLDLILLSVTRMAKLVVPPMTQTGGGALVNISAFGAVEPSLGFPVSSVLRASLSAYAHLFAERYAAQGLRMNNLLPGFVATFPEDAARLAKIPAGRYATIDEIAQTAAFLVSDGAAYINGQNIRVDGGLTRAV